MNSSLCPRRIVGVGKSLVCFSRLGDQSSRRGTGPATAIGVVDQLVAYCAANSPLTQPLTGAEVGNVAAFLASDLSSGITGTTVYVDKGYHAMGIAVAGPVPRRED